MSRTRIILASLILFSVAALVAVVGLRGDESSTPPAPVPVLPAGANRVELIVRARDGAGRSLPPSERSLTVITAAGARLSATTTRRGRVILYGVPAGALQLRTPAGGRSRVGIPVGGGAVSVVVCVQACR